VTRSSPIFTVPGPRTPANGFTLIEAALATIIVGVGIVAMMQLFAVCTQNNAAASHQTAAMLLANNIQETMASLPFNDPIQGSKYFGPEPNETAATWNDTDDFDGASFNPPIDSMRNELPNLAQYTQQVTVVPVDPSQLTAEKTAYTGAVRVTVQIFYQPNASAAKQEVYRISWTRFDG
jgi:type II secretory pathway pseudopilin PulG